MDDSEVLSICQRTWKSVIEPVEKEGYREGYDKGQRESYQNGFDDGFKEGFNDTFEMAHQNAILSVESNLSGDTQNVNISTAIPWLEKCKICNMKGK